MIVLRPLDYEALSAIVRREAGLHLPQTKLDFVAARLQKRLRKLGVSSFADYLEIVSAEAGGGVTERRELVSALTTNVTDVFRELHHFRLFGEHLEVWRKKRLCGSAPGRYRIWSAGCSSGEEPLSLAAVCHAHLGRGWAEEVEILATDVDHAVLKRAEDRSADLELASALLKSPLASKSAQAQVDPVSYLAGLRAGIAFRHHNLLEPLNIVGRFDTIFCRNVTIYFDAASQNAVHSRLVSRLMDGGLLALGHSERPSKSQDLLTPVGRTAFLRSGTASTGSTPEHRTCH